VPLSDTSDPLIRVLVDLRRDVRQLRTVTAALFVVLVICFGIALYLRANDLEKQTQTANNAAVEECFRSANQRADLRSVRRNRTLPVGVRDLVDTTIINLPSLAECLRLADKLGVKPPRELRLYGGGRG
jgi:hypothetical protein